MIKRTLEISRDSMHLSVKLDQLRLQKHGDDPRRAPSVPCEDIGLIVVDQPGVTYSHAALSRLMDFGAALMICGRDHLPNGMLLPLGDHCEVRWRIDDQIAASKPILKNIWKQIVVAKIKAQANLLMDDAARQKLTTLTREVRSGDPTNIEAQAARIYWQHWLTGQKFKRDPDGDGLNALLNYGYAVLRAAVARAVVSAGLFPVLGIKHSSRSNAFCLADDLMEPIRPMVDAKVRDLHEWNMTKLDHPTKAHLLQLMVQNVICDGQKGPLMVSLHRMTASLLRCYQGQDKKLHIPTPAESE